MKNKLDDIDFVERTISRLELHRLWKRGIMEDRGLSAEQLEATIDDSIALLHKYAAYLKLDFFLEMPEKKFQKEIDKYTTDKNETKKTKRTKRIKRTKGQK